jgi:hypothetical protein
MLLIDTAPHRVEGDGLNAAAVRIGDRTCDPLDVNEVLET